MTGGGMALGLMDTCMTLSRKDHQKRDQETILGGLVQMDISTILSVKIRSDECLHDCLRYNFGLFNTSIIFSA